MNRQELFENGIALMKRYCETNKIEVPTIIKMSKEGRYYHLNTCAFYRHNRELLKSERSKELIGTDDKIGSGGNIFIAINKCANIGWAGRAWSYPGYVVDRTPYGVLQHELGHYVDDILSNKNFHFAYNLIHGKLDKYTINIKPITGYCPGKSGDHQWCSEWFAECFRLYVTNPDLFKNIRPEVYDTFLEENLIKVETRHWKTVLKNAPERTFLQAQAKIDAI